MRLSCLTRMQRILAYCRRFAHNARHSSSRLTGYHSAAQLQRALMGVVHQEQLISFAEECKEASQSSSRHRRPTPIIQPLSNLPPEGITAASAFLTTGVDYAGPFFITSARLRDAAVTKTYLVVFICFATKAVHFEVASKLSSAIFIVAYRRFIARRGHPTVIFSDNGTNFVGAHHELRDLSRLLGSPKHQQSLSAADVRTSSGLL
ncbi:hypothetical protein KPH14_000931 [Odynerus spinipes]|uniref:Integrase catalytic domain-containing protein n=1 Tax=Odynerus spinipes TaxID=1348599 RepID=A0AAD9RET2_9HYME|nr:hypothetical protein KPH14_000931 [Odynerus spinipes]